MQSNQCQLFEPHEPLVILIEYDMCSLLQFPNTSGYAKDDDWIEDYRYEYYAWSQPVNSVPVWCFRWECCLFLIIIIV